MRSMRRDDSVTQQQVTKGTVRRILQFARPYRWLLTVFMVLVVVDAATGAANPLHLPRNHRPRRHPFTKTTRW